ncbi:MAG: HAD family phosphatase [Bacteroidales bacterium]|nr:HAD family phosphatase [Bacteroidales bacterium]
MITDGITHIALDMGGVVLHIDHEQAVARFEEIGVADARRFLNPYHQQGIFGQLEGGLIDSVTFVDELSRFVGKELTYEQCRYAWLGYLGGIPERNLSALRRLRREGFRICLLSNTNPFFFEWAESGAFDGCGHSIRDYFDSLYVSFRCRMLKPTREIYEYVLRCEEIRPEQLLFVDDSERNTEAAAQLGIRTLHVETNGDWAAKLFGK